MNENHHEMVLELTHTSGMQGWYCPSCGRRILLLVPPDESLVIVEPGDPYASHSGSIGGLRVATVQVEESHEEPRELSEEHLRPWIKALEKLDLDL